MVTMHQVPGLVSRTLASSEDIAFAKGLLLPGAPPHRTPPLTECILSTLMTCGVSTRGQVLQCPHPPVSWHWLNLSMFPWSWLGCVQWGSGTLADWAVW